MNEKNKQKYPKTIKAIVADLRERGELDEEKWKILQTKDRRFKVALILIMLLSILAIVSTDYLGIVVGLVFFTAALYTFFNREIEEVTIYSLGEKVKGIVTNVEIQRPISLEQVPRPCRLSYEFYCKNGKKRGGYFAPVANKSIFAGIPDIGDEIDVFYLKEKPSESLPLIPFYYKQYNLKKDD